MELRTPLNQMTPEETHAFNLLNFDKERETARKKMADVLFARTPEQVQEEEMLLVELARIVKNQNRTLEERRDLFHRLEAPASQGSINAYTGSQGLAHLRDIMLSGSDKGKKRKSIAIAGNGMDAGLQHSPATATAGERLGGGGGGAASHKDVPQAKKQVRKLTAEEEVEYGVTHHDKLASGVKFRSAMVTTSIKGGTAQKVQQALAQLEIANRLAVPTVRTVQRFEQLQAAVGALLDAKKAVDKIENELRVVRAQQETMRGEG
jgi:DNA methyltransferase 1-associated protein 1